MRAEELRSWQNKRLRGIIRHAAAHVPDTATCSRRVGCAPMTSVRDDLARLPRLSRTTVHKGPRRFRRMICKGTILS